MNIDQAELLIRVDQNVINLVEFVKNHIASDEKYQQTISTDIAGLKESRARMRGVVGFASVMWGLIGGYFGVRYGSR